MGLLYRGFTVPAAKLAVLTGAEIFGRHQQIRRVRGSKLDEAEVLRKARDVMRELGAFYTLRAREESITKRPIAAIS